MPTQPPGPGFRVNIRKTLTRNTAWNYVGFAVNLVTNLLLFPYVVREIGDAAAGIWLLLGSVTGYMGLLELGLVPALAQSVAVYRSRGDISGLNRAVSTAFVLLVLLAAIPVALLAAVPWMVDVLKVPEALSSEARIVFLIAIAGFAARMPLAAYQALLLGTQRQDRCNQLWILMVAAKFIFAVVLLWSGFRLVAIVAMEALVHLAAGALQIRWARAEVPDLAVRWRSATRSEARIARRVRQLAAGVIDLQPNDRADRQAGDRRVPADRHGHLLLGRLEALRVRVQPADHAGSGCHAARERHLRAR